MEQISPRKNLFHYGHFLWKIPMRLGKNPVLKSNEKRNNSMKNGHRGSKFVPEVHLNGPHKKERGFLDILFFGHSLGEKPTFFQF